MPTPQPNPTPAQPPLRAVPMSLFPVCSSLQDVMELAETKLPITNRNELVSLLMTFQNTLLKVLEDEKTQVPGRPPVGKDCYIRPR